MFKGISISDRIKESIKKNPEINKVYLQDSGINILDFVLKFYKLGHRSFLIETYRIPLKTIRLLNELKKKNCKIQLLISDTIPALTPKVFNEIKKSKIPYKIENTHVKSLVTGDFVCFSSGNVEPDGEIEFIMCVENKELAKFIKYRYGRI